MLYESIKLLFPSAVVGVDFALRDDGDGPYIEKWNIAAPRPTAAALAAAGKVVVTLQLCATIDAMADKARQAVAGDPLRAVEYEKAAAEALEFQAAGYPADAVPRTVAAWAIGGRTAEQSAIGILAEAATYNEALYLLRETRLKAKELVRQAMAAGNAEQARDIAEAAVASIRASIAGIGNTGAQA